MTVIPTSSIEYLSPFGRALEDQFCVIVCYALQWSNEPTHASSCSKDCCRVAVRALMDLLKARLRGQDLS
jgi:hypothetical protein